MVQVAQSATLSQQAVESLRLEILSGRLKPGEPLRLAALANSLGFSVSVTREALTVLAAHTLVDSTPNQGFRVATVSRQDLLDLTDLRITLEGTSLGRSIELGDTRWEAGIVSSFHLLQSVTMMIPGTRIPSLEWVDRHAEFHDALGSGCESPRLIQLVKSLRDSAELYRQVASSRSAESDRDVLAEHLELMDLALARKKDDAVAALAHHLSLTTEAVLAQHFLEE